MVVLILCYFIRIMDPTSSLGRIFLGENVYGSPSEKVKGHGDWDAPEYTDTTGSKEKKINLAVDENLISNEYAVKLCLDYEVKKVAGVITVYPKQDPLEDDSKKTEKSVDDWDQLLDFNFDDIPQLDGEELSPFVCKMWKKEAGKEALALRISQKFTLLKEVRPVLETMAYNDKYKKVLNEIWKDKVELDGMIVKEEEEAINKVKGGALKEKDDPEVFIFPIRFEGKIDKNALSDTGSDINTMPYQIYKKLGREEIKKVGVTTIIAKFLILDIPIDRDAPIVVGRAFIYTIGGIVNTSERLFLTFDGICHQTFPAARFDVLRTAESDSDDEEEYEIKRNKFKAPIHGPKLATYLNYNNLAERSLALQTVINPFRKISVWKKAISFLGSLHVPLQHIEWKPDYKGCYTNEEEAKGQWRTEIREGYNKEAKSRNNTKLANLLLRHVYSLCVMNWDVLNRMGCDGEIDDMLRIKLRKAASNEEIITFVAWIRAFNINEPIYLELCHEFYSTYEFDEVCVDDELKTKKIIKFRLGGHAHSLTLLEFAHRLGLYHADELDEEGFDVYLQGGLHSDEHFNAQEYWLSISQEENLSLSRSQDSTIWSPVLRVIHKMITYGLCQRTIGHQNGYANVAWLITRWMKRKGTGTQKESQICYGQFITKIARKARVLSDEPGVLRVSIPRPPSASMQDLHDRIGSMEIRQREIERMAYRQSYHWDRYARVFEHMAGVYSVVLHGAYNLTGYAQPQYD
ncbi:hypothetical protein Tco_1515985 [Tanacetum coccineum]